MAWACFIKGKVIIHRATIDELKSTVEGLADSLYSIDVTKAVANVMKRANVCKVENGG